MAITFKEMQKFATEAWGPLGSNAVARWKEFNDRFFDGKLKPVPLVITRAQPYGARLAYCSYGLGGGERTITLNIPKDHDSLVADNSVLLHEMIHQCLFERGEYPSHDGEPWRKEIMRLHRVLTKKDIWAGRSKTARRKRKEGREMISEVVRINEPHPETGAKSLSQFDISRWPHSCDICLGELGSNIELRVTKRSVA